MSQLLDRAVPWGRSLDEYSAFFSLDRADLTASILGVADGPASFNAESDALGRPVVSVDPLYATDAPSIMAAVTALGPTMTRLMRDNRHRFVWTDGATPEDMVERRLVSTQRFLAHFAGERASRRYVAGALPTLPFADKHFDLALCSHFLFLYTTQFDQGFHIAACLELCRVARQVRVFPLIDLDGRPSVHLPPVRNVLDTAGIASEVRRVDYEFQRGGNEMLVIGEDWPRA